MSRLLQHNHILTRPWTPITHSLHLTHTTHAWMDSAVDSPGVRRAAQTYEANSIYVKLAPIPKMPSSHFDTQSEFNLTHTKWMGSLWGIIYRCVFHHTIYNNKLTTNINRIASVGRQTPFDVCWCAPRFSHHTNAICIFIVYLNQHTLGQHLSLLRKSFAIMRTLCSVDGDNLEQQKIATIVINSLIMPDCRVVLLRVCGSTDKW